MEKTYTVKQVAEILGYSTNSIYTFLKEKRIQGIRVGKGRFRISQTELNRVFHLSKSLSSPPVTTLPVTTIPEAGEVLHLKNYDKGIYMTIPSLFDWFLGVASILLGISLFLFSSMKEQAIFDPYLNWMLPLQISFIAGGIGILVNTIGKNMPVFWYWVFSLALAATYSVFGLIKLQTAGIEASLLYGLIAIMALSNVFIKRRSALSFMFLITLYGLATAIAVIARAPLILPPILTFVTTKPVLFGTVWFVVVLGMSLFVVWGYFRKRVIFFTTMFIAAPIFIIVALWQANILMWQKSVLTLVMGLACMFAPTYEQVREWDYYSRRFIFILSVSLLATLIAIFGVIWLTQSNMIEFSRNEIAKKTTMGKLITESTLESVKTSITDFSNNPFLVDALLTKDKKMLSRLSQGVYEGDRDFVRVVVMDSNGIVLSTYPYDASLEGKDLSFREHFKTVLETGKLYVSNQFESIYLANKENIVTVAVPVFNRNKQIIGELSGPINLPLLSYKLQQLASTYRGEYFVVIDGAGRRLIHPELSLLNKEIEPDSSLRKGLHGDSGIGEGYNYKGTLMLQSYDSIKNTRWAIGIQAPVSQILQPTSVVTFSMYVIVAISAVVIETFLFYMRRKNFMKPLAS